MIKNKNTLLNLMGVLLIIFFVIRVIFLVRDGSLENIFWLCNHAPLILGIAILFRSSFWITAEISFVFAGVFVWVADYLSKIIFDFHIFGSTDYLFPIIDQWFFYVTSLIHLFSLPLAVWALFLIKKKHPFAWKGALIHAVVLIPFVIYFKEKYNLNCFLEPCISWIPCFYLYPLVAFIGYFILFVIPVNKILVKLLNKAIKSKTNQQSNS